MTTQTQAKPLFAATLTPHGSFGRPGLPVVVAGAAIAASLPGMLFFANGAWPILGFLGLDAVLVWWALSRTRRDGRRCEKVILWPDQLELKQIDHKGKETLNRFNPSSVRLVVDRDFNERTTAVRLRTGDRDTVIGAFLSQDDKSSFAKAFGTALRKARR